MLLKSPKDSAFAAYYGFSALGPTAFTMPDYAQNAILSTSWQVRRQGLSVTLTDQCCRRTLAVVAGRHPQK